MLPQLGKVLILTGALFLVLGLILTFTSHLSFLRLGRLPGDLYIKRDHISFYFPLTTSILLSLLLTLIFHFLFRR
ncbi:MAG: DUF2905 domain-containing protein [Terriglobia bacterium]